MNEEHLKLAAYVKVSSYRYKVLTCLNEGIPKMPTSIARQVGILPNHISKTLSELKNEGIITCINPEARKGRLYKITNLGMEINSILQERKL